MRGFYVTYDRNYSYLGIRGYGPSGDYNSRIAVMIDGHRLNDNIFDAALVGSEFPIDADLIDRVEVIRGPNSSMYVASDFLGVINIITKRGRDLQKVSVAGEAASYGSYRGRVSYGNKFSNGLELLLSSSFYDEVLIAPHTKSKCTARLSAIRGHRYPGLAGFTGDRFPAVLPAATGDKQARSALITRHSLREDHGHLRILLVEDNAVNQLLAQRMLEKRGHTVTVATNGEEALAALEANSYQLVFMDVQMPEMDGFEATAAIREREKKSGTHVPIVAMTAHAMVETRSAARRQEWMTTFQNPSGQKN